MTVETLVTQGQKILSSRQSLTSLWQEIADNFYPERADFTYRRSLGQEFADHLMTSQPILVRRELGDTFATMLRRGMWFKTKTKNYDRLDNAGKQWLEWANGVQYRAMYDPEAGIKRATKECDHDFAAFGQGVISPEIDWNAPNGPTLLYRCWHLRDVGWTEGYNGQINRIVRDWKPTAHDLIYRFGDKAHEKVHETANDQKAGDVRINCQHQVLTADQYRTVMGSDAKSENIRQPWVSVYVDAANQHVMEETGQWIKGYIIPRWQTVSASQYSYSPMSVAGLPDARLLQQITMTLLEAGEWAVSPPYIATQKAIRSDLALYSRGVTWVDHEYENDKHDAIRPLNTQSQGMPFGIEMQDRAMAQVNMDGYIDKLRLPVLGPEMTAFEVARRIEEWIRQVLPVFEPVEDEYSAPLCNDTFELMLRNGGFGAPQDIPESLRGQDIEFQFESPIKEAEERKKGQQFLEMNGVIAAAAEYDPTVKAHVDIHETTRDVLSGIGVPAKWLTDEEAAARAILAAKQREASAEVAGALATGADVAKKVGEAGQAVGAAQQQGRAA